jgi:hypothetical protein
MRTVEFNQALGGMEGAQLPPLPLLKLNDNVPFRTI